MKRIDAIRAIIIEDASKPQVKRFKRMLDIFMRGMPPDDKIVQILKEDAPFELHKKLIGELTGERILSMFSIIFAVINAPRSTDYDQQSALEGLFNGINTAIDGK